MYNNREENSYNTRSTTVLDDDRRVIEIDRVSTTQKPSVGFAPVTKNPSRLTVTNTGRTTAEIGKVVKQKEKVQTKNIAMMVVYSVVALALAAVIAVNAITIGTVSSANTQLAAELATLETSYTTLTAELSAVSSTERMAELASSQLGLTETAASTATFSVPGYIELETQVFENNWFDNMLDKLF